VHPVVEKHLSGTTDLGVVLTEYEGPPEPILTALLHLRQSISGQYSMAEAISEADAISPEGQDPALYHMLLQAWSVVSLRSGRPEEAGALVDLADHLTSDEIPVELRASLLIVHGVHVSAAGNMQLANDYYAPEALRIMPRESPRYGLTILQRAMWLARLGRLREMQEEFDAVRPRTEPRARPSATDLMLVRFFDHVVTGRCAAAVELEDQVHLLPGTMGYGLAEARPALDLMLDRWDPEKSEPPKVGGVAMEDWPPPWAMSAYLLLRGKPGEALGWARKMAGSELTWMGFPPYNLIRAELACGHGEAARRVLSMKRERGNPHYLDPLFTARVERLAGNHREAARQFAAALRAVERYDAGGRMDFELKLACELSRSDLIDLGRAAAEFAAEEVPAPTPAPPEEEPGPKVRVRSPAPAAVAERGAGRLVGPSGALEAVREIIRRFGSTDATVLIRGETGVGKELAARALHEEGPRARAPFIAVNCGAITESLLESELFGHERGAFTGASRARKGIFEEAGGGTVLLDEIGDIAPRLQVVLLRVLESGEIRAVGASRARKVSCRIVAATNADLEAMAEEGRFRKDLLFRLKRLEIHIPPLRERPEDVSALAELFLAEGRDGDARPSMSGELVAELKRRAWPGNVRELRNAVETMRLLNSDKLDYELADLPPEAGVAADAPERSAPAAADHPGPIAQAPAPARGRERGPAGHAAPRNAEEVLGASRHAIRRLERLRELFREHGKLTRAEAARILGVSPVTATKDLRKLIAEGLVEKVEPSRSPRSHYFRLRE
jgi:DNA-binding NtrC family response regulator